MVRMSGNLRRLERLRNTRNSSRVLNLIALEKDFAAAEAAPTGRQRSKVPASEGEPFFINSAFSKAIFVKHNLRPEEYDLFDERSAVETKLIVPFETTRLELGGRSFFLGERSANDTLRTIFRIDPDSRDPRTARDMKVLQVLNKVPSFDAFILREALRCAGLNVDHRYFSASFAETKDATEAIYADMGALIQTALGQAASEEQLERFVEQVWNVEDGGQNLFFEALKIPRSEWREVVFAWKALLYYRQKIHKEADRLPQLARAIKAVRLTNNVNMCSVSELQDLKHQFIRNLNGLQNRAHDDYERLSQALVSALANFEVSKFRQWLRALSSNIVKLGTDVTTFDQAATYYLYEFGGKNCLDGCAYELGLRGLNDLIAQRFAQSERRARPRPKQTALLDSDTPV